MSYLLRTRTGNFYLDNAIKLEDIDRVLENNNIKDIMIPMEQVLSDYNKFIVTKNGNKFLYNGNKISFNYIQNKKDLKQNEKIIIYDEDNNLIGIYVVLIDCIKPLTMLI